MKTQSISKLFVYVALCCMLVFAIGSLAGCKGSDGANGTNAPTTGTVSGTVVTSTGSVPLAGVAVTTAPAVGTTATTAADGSYSLALPGGSYTLTFAKANYTSATSNVNVANSAVTTANANLPEAASGKPSLTVTASGNNVGYGQPFTVTANAASPLGATLTYTWTGAAGTGNTATATSQAATFTPSKITSSGSSDNSGGAFGGATALASDPGGYISPYAINPRFEVLPINADTRGTKSVTVKVDDGQGGTTSVSVTVNSAAPNPGVKQVAIGNAVYMNSGVTTSCTWSVTNPDGSAGTISTVSGTTRIATFTPAAEGKYVVSFVTGTAAAKSLNVFAGKYVGGITGGGYATLVAATSGDKKNNAMWYDTATYGSNPTFTNWPTVSANGNCTGCHDGTSAAIDVFTPWSQTVHATFFARGLEGINTNSGTCLTCHTTGYDGSASSGNGGFDDMASTGTNTSWVYAKGVGKWGTMTSSYPQLAALASIQCENCHGPQSTASGANSGHMTSKGSTGLIGAGTSSTAVRVGYSAEVCGTCHSSGTGHHLFSEWENLNPDTNYKGHGKKSVAVSHPNCACHSAQAFVTQLDQWKNGNSYYGLASNAQTWASAESEPITCTACHDPHSDANPNQLRVYNGYTTPNWGGLTVDGLGKGAICTVCHTTRVPTKCASSPTVTGLCTSNGDNTYNLTSTGAYLREDTEPFNNGNPELYTTGHDASQADVLMGRNAYFMGTSLPMLSKHANVEDSCVGCHMTLNPQTHLSHAAPAVSGHVMYIKGADKATLCANCHGSATAAVDGEALAAQVDDLMVNLQTAMAAQFKKQALAAGGTFYYVSSWGNTTTPPTYTNVTVTSGSTVTSGGSTAVYINGTSRNFASLVTDTTTWTPLVLPSNMLTKAAWNYKLLSIDDSEGVHNPSFVLGVLNNTIGYLNQH